MVKKVLLVICVCVLLFSAIGQGQSSYYLVEKTIIRIVDNNELDMVYGISANTQFKNEFKWDSNGHYQYSASYYWTDYILEQKDGWIGISKDEFIDANETGKNIQVFYSWSYDTNDWVIEKKIERKRNSDNKEMYTVVWKNDAKEWFPSYKEEHEYLEGKKIYTEYSWNIEKRKLVPQYKHEDEYNIKGERVLWTSYNWDILQDCWKLRSKADFNYNSEGLVIRQVDYLPKNSTWIRHSKTDFVKYTKNRQVELCIFYNWDSKAKKWVETNRNDVRKINKKVKTNPNEQRHWDENRNTWIDNVKIESQYDELGREILSVSHRWNQVDKKWEQVSKKEIKFDDYNNPIFNTTYIWQQEKWIFSESQENRYKKRE